MVLPRAAGRIGPAAIRIISTQEELRMFKNPLVSAVFALLVVGLGFSLNPTPQQHHEKIKQAVAEKSQLAGALGLGSLAAFASSYHSLGVASYTEVNGKTLTVGAFGLVILLKQD
jgi:hypothetical protein